MGRGSNLEKEDKERKVYSAKDLSNAYREGYKEGYHKGHTEGMEDEHTRITTLYTLIIKNEGGYRG